MHSWAGLVARDLVGADQLRREPVLVALGLGGVPSAVADNPGVNHFTMTESFTDPDFCGTGQPVDISLSVKATEFLAPNQPVDSRTVSEVDIVYTNPQYLATVLLHAAGQVSDTILSGDPARMHTVETTLRGRSGRLRTADGVVLLGAGHLVLHVVFNGEEVVSREVVVDKGPHPNAESGEVLFCDVTTHALGLS